MKNELKIKDKGYSFVEETTYLEIENSIEVETYINHVIHQFVKEEEEMAIFNKQRDQVISEYKRIFSKGNEQEASTIETTWIELDDVYLSIFDGNSTKD